MEFLLHCARASVEPERADRLRALAAGQLDWDRLLQLAQRNGLSPLLYSHLNQICAESVPAAQFAFLRDYFQKNSAFALLLAGELMQLLRTFSEHGIKAVPYKGPAIAVKLYGNLALRQFGDLDILVRESDVWRASELIEARGFTPHFNIPETKRTAFLRLSYVQLFRRDAGRTLIELHWSIAPRFFGVKFDASAFWKRLEPLSIQGASTFSPCAQDLLLMLCVHGAKDCWERLEWVAAIAELLRRTQDLDWERVWRQAHEMRCRRMLELGLLLAQGLFDAQLPEKFAVLGQSRELLRLATQVSKNFCRADAHSATFSERVRFHLQLKDSFAEKIRHCVRLAATTTPVDWAALPLPGTLSFAYPLLRAVRLTRKYGLNKEPAHRSNLPNRNEAA
jgi:hypothetical protein